MALTLVRSFQSTRLDQYAGQPVDEHRFHNTQALGGMPPGAWHAVFPTADFAIQEALRGQCLGLWMYVDTSPLLYDNWEIVLWTPSGTVGPARVVAAPYPGVIQIGIAALIVIVAVSLAIIAGAIAVTTLAIKAPGVLKNAFNPWLWAAVGGALLVGTIFVGKLKKT